MSRFTARQTVAGIRTSLRPSANAANLLFKEKRLAHPRRQEEKKEYTTRGVRDRQEDVLRAAAKCAAGAGRGEKTNGDTR